MTLLGSVEFRSSQKTNITITWEGQELASGPLDIYDSTSELYSSGTDSSGNVHAWGFSDIYDNSVETTQYSVPSEGFIGWYTIKNNIVDPFYSVKLSDATELISTNPTITAKDVIGKCKYWQYSSNFNKNYILIAICSKASYTITLDANGGTVSQTSLKCYDGEKFGTLPTPTRDGYSFLGWYSAKTGGTIITDTTVFSSSTSPRTLYAHWKGRTVTTKLDANGGAVSPTSITKEYGDKFGTLPIPVRANYEFIGWFTARFGGNQITSDSKVTYLGTVYAHWLGNMVTITIDADVGTASATSVTRRIGEQYGILADVTKIGSSLIGFFDKATGQQIATSDYVTPTSTRNVKCGWADSSGITALVTVFDSNPKGTILLHSSTYQLSVGDNYPTAIYCSDPLFLGLYTSPFGGTKVEGKISNDSPRVLFARYSKPTFTISLDANGGAVSPSSLTREYGTAFNLPTPYYDDGSSDWNNIFRQWQLKSAKSVAKSAVSSSDIVTSSVSLIAQWESINQKNGNSTLSPTETLEYQNSVQIHLVTNGGTCPFGNTVIGYKVGNVASALSSPYLPGCYKIGYSFEGWSLNSDLSGDHVTTTLQVLSAGKNTVYADFSPIDITISFYNNTTSPDDTPYITSIIKFGSEYGSGTHSWYTPTVPPAGYEFTGWFTERDGGAQISQHDIFIATSTDRLYAHYKARDITVIFNARGGTVSPTSKTVTVDKAYGELPIPSRTGYSFSGWSKASAYDDLVTEDTIVQGTYADSITLYAIWDRLPPKTVVFNPNKGYLDPDKTEKICYVGEMYGELPTPTRDLFEFIGWYSDEESGLLITEDSIFTESSPTVLYAHWNQVYIEITFDPNGGYVEPTSKKIVIGGTYGKLPTPTLEGCVFIGWYSSLDGVNRINEDDTFTLGTSPETLYAHWKDIPKPPKPPVHPGEIAIGNLVFSQNDGMLCFSKTIGYLIHKHHTI